MRNKRGITHIEAILSIVIFLVGIVMVMLLVRPTFISTEPSQVQLNDLEEEFKEYTKSQQYNLVFYTKTDISSYREEYILKDESPYYKIYTNEENLINIIEYFEFTAEHYTFPMKINIYDYDTIDTFESEKDFQIIINGVPTEKSKEPPEQVSINAKEIEIKFIEGTEITMKNVILRVW